MLAYVRGFITLFVLLTMLLYLPPGKSYQKYIRFFAELILTLSIISPVMSVICDSDEFMELIEYEEFTENLSEISKDMQRIEYLHNDYYLEEYENAIAEDVRQIAGRVAEGYGFSVKEAKVHMAEDYTVDAIQIWMTDQGGEEIVIGKIVLQEGTKLGTDAVYAGITQELSDYYQLDPSKIEITYTKTG